MTSEDPEMQEPVNTGTGPVLVAVDFSADSESALLWACRFAGQTGADVLALHVVHDPAEAPGAYRKGEDDVLRPMADVAAEMLEEFVARLKRAHPELEGLSGLKTSLVRGIPETRILELADKVDACMIVMGSRGLTGLPHLLLGSKSERVAQLSLRPVTIVKGTQRHD